MSPVVASRRRFSSSRVLSFLLANLVWLAPVLLMPATSAAAATDTFTVSVTTDDSGVSLATAQTNCPANNPGGSGSCSLRDAMTAASADANSAIIDMTGITGTITVTSNLPQVYTVPTTNNVAFNGPGAAALTVSGANAYQLFVILYGSASFQNFTVANGFVSATGGCTCDPGYGAGIYAYSGVGLTLTDMVITGNSAAAGAGGVLAGGMLTVTGTTFSNNTSPSSAGGIAGALYAIGSPATIYQSTFSGNSAWIGSAIYTYTPVTLTISDSTFANNSNGTEATVGGSGGIFNDNGSTLTIHDSTFWNNVAAAGLGGALNNAGTMTVTNSIVGSPSDSTGTAECYSAGTANGAGCPATGDGNGNITAPSNFNLSTLGYYGGLTETLLPLTGSAAICGGKSGTPYAEDENGALLTVDQRGLPLDTGCTTGSTDAGSVQTHYLVVTTAADSDDGSCTTTTCSLRDAINAANTAGNADISFSTSINGDTLTLTSNLPAITAASSVNIVGNGAGTFTIDGAGKYQPFYIPGATSVSISGLTLQHCYNSTNGGGVGYAGAILDYGTLSVSGVDFLNNTAGISGTAGEGAAILDAASNGSPLTITNSYFSGNTVIASGGNGGAVLSGAPLTITGSTFVNNAGVNGSAVYVPLGYSATVNNSTFENNTADATLGEGALNVSGPLTITNSTFANNAASDGTGIYNDGPSFSIYNSILDNAAACDGANPCPTATNAATGNVVGTTTPVVGTVDSNGGSIPTALPVGASICGGNASLVNTGYTDERGFGIDPLCGAGLMDSGAVQSDYTGISFSAANYAAISASPIVDPSVIVIVNERGQSNANGVGGVPITLDYTGTGTVNAGGTASTVAGTGATFSALTITSTATTPQPVSASISGSSVAAASATITFTQGTATTTTPASKVVSYSATAQNVTLTATVTPAAVSEGNVTFTVTGPNPATTVIGTATVSGTVAAGNASVSYALPAGLAAGTYTITAKYIDGATGSYASSSGTATLTVTTVTIAPTTLTAITVGVAMPTQTLAATGGTGPYTYAVTAGALPTGISLAPSGVTAGQLTGTATEGGSIGFTVTATDSLGATGSQAYTWTVNAPTLTMTPTPGNLAVTTNVTYSQAFVASGGTATYTYTESGALPTGLTWTAGTGTIAGKTTDTGSFPITITAKDSSTGSGPYSQNFSYTLVVSAPAITIAPTTLTAITVGVAMPTQTLVASGGATPYTYAVTTGALPAGISLSSAGALTGTATEGGSIGFTVTATDNNGNKGTQAYTWTVNAPTLTMTPTPGNLAVTTNITYSQAFVASGGTATYTYTESGMLPTGLTWTAGTATIAGKTTDTGSFPITITAKDSSTGSGPYSQNFSYTLVVTAPTITIAPATLTAITVGVAMPTQTLVASGGATPYTYAVTTGALPAGISLSSAGALTGTATEGGSIGFTVTATDNNGNKGTQAYTWTVNAPTLTMTPTPGNLAVNAETAYSQAFVASGGTATYAYTESGTLPTGLTWNAGTATISGTATQSGSFPITITAKDSSTGSGPYSQNFSYTLVVTAPTITMTPPAGALTATVGAAFTQAFSASGGVGPYTYTESGTLPAGITFSGNTLSGTATQGGTFSGITITAKDTDGFTDPQIYTLTVNAPTITVTASGSLNLTAETVYSVSFSAAGGTSPYTYTEAGTLPAGLTWTAGTATISGTATQSGSFPITIAAKDSSTGTGPYTSAAIGFTLVVTAPAITITPASLPAATADAAYSQQLMATGGTGTYTWTETGALPAGITLSTGGLLSGTATAAGSFPITVTAKDGDNFTGTQAYTLVVGAPVLTIAPATLPAAATYAAFTQTFTASGGLSPYTWSETGTLPTGVTFNAATATLSGTPTQAGTFPITIKVTDSTTGTGSPFSTSAGYTLAVSAPTITIAPTTLPAAAIAVAYSQSVTASGGTGPYTYSVTTGALPAGLSLSSAGAITGTPTAGGVFSFTITAKDSGSFTGTQNYSLTVTAPTIALLPAAGTLTVTAQSAYSQTFTASGGTSPYTYTETGTLPTGLTFSNGVLSGTTAQVGSFPITVKATDSSTGTGPYSSAAVAYTVVVGSATVTISWAQPSPITYGTTLAGVLNATAAYNGTAVQGTFTYTATPTGGSASTVTAATVLAAGSYTLTASFAPSSSSYTTPSPKTVTLTVNQAQPTLAWTPATTIGYGTTLSALLNATASFGGNPVAGAFAYTATPAGGTASAVTSATVLPDGTYTLAVTFTPTDTTDYKTATATAPLTVTSQSLTVTANNATKVYGTANPTFTGTVTGAVNGDTFTESFSTTATTTSNVGTYPIVPSVTGANLSDYTVVVDDGTLTVTQAGTTTTLTASSNSVNPGASVTLTATVASATTGTPTGTVTFYDGSTMLGTGTLAAGASGDVATYTTSSLLSGSHIITAVYSGDANFTASSTTTSLIVTVAALGFTMSASPSQQTGNPGTTFSYSLALAPAFAGTPYPGTVSFAANGGPTGAVITFSPSTLAANAGSQTVQMSVATSTSSAALQPLSTGRKLVPVAFALLLLPLAGTRRMRRNGKRLGRLLAILLLGFAGVAATTALSGCGSSAGGTQQTNQGTQYTITVTATSGSVTKTTTVNLTLL